MTVPTSALFALTILAGIAGVATAAPLPGGAPPGAVPGVGARPGSPAHGVRPPGAAVPRYGAYPVGGHGYWYRPSVRLYYGGPYWGGWGWPAYPWPAYPWPGYYASGYYHLPNYYGPGYGYVPPNYVYGPPGVVTSTGGVVYIEREGATVSTQQPEPAPAAAPTPAPAAATAAPPPAGTPWWYLCSSPRGAYPYVRECPGGWERVPAVPPDPVK